LTLNFSLITSYLSFQESLKRKWHVISESYLFLLQNYYSSCSFNLLEDILTLKLHSEFLNFVKILSLNRINYVFFSNLSFRFYYKINYLNKIYLKVRKIKMSENKLRDDELMLLSEHSGVDIDVVRSWYKGIYFLSLYLKNKNLFHNSFLFKTSY